MVVVTTEIFEATGRRAAQSVALLALSLLCLAHLVGRVGDDAVP